MMKTIDGVILNATIKQTAGQGTIDLAARGGTTLNPDYARGLRAIIEIIAWNESKITKIEVVSKPALKLKPSERVVQIKGIPYPLEFTTPSELGDQLADCTYSEYFDTLLDRLRKAICQGIAKAGRKKGAKGSGNGNKLIRIHYTPDASKYCAGIDWSEYQNS